MDQEKFNLVIKEEVYAKSYEELVNFEKELMYNPEATDLDIAFVSAVVLDRELEMGVFKGYTMDEVFGRLLKESIFEESKNNNKRKCKYIIHHSKNVLNLKF